MKLQKYLFSPKSALVFICVIWLMVSFSVEALARAGGGGVGGGGRVFRRIGNGTSVIETIFHGLIVAFIIIEAIYINHRINKKKKKIKLALAKMAHEEPQWSQENLLTTAKEKFVSLQAAWGDQNLEVIKQHLHPDLYLDWHKQILGQIERHEKNIIALLLVNKISIVDVQNYIDDKKDEFTVRIDAYADDQIWQNGSMIESCAENFREFWTFEWKKSQWVLKSVYQSKDWKRFTKLDIIFENKNRKVS